MQRTQKQQGKATKRAQRFLLAALVATVSSRQLAFAQTANGASDVAKRVVLISVPDRKLAVLEDGIVLAQFPVAVGASDSPSPTGEFQIVNRVSNPTYYHAGSVIPTGKDNPVGTRWLGLSQKGYGIHGTNVPRSIGHAASHGCIRLRNRDMERLFGMLRVGDVVEIRGKRDEQITQVFGPAGGTGDGDTILASTQVPAEAGQ
ncbi:MAG: L,D-transpeptidase [Candidatus Sulfotelmatobacter sp.]|jgi:lipoprotein-anchoring transpeptidase ErfK/SrfK